MTLREALLSARERLRAGGSDEPDIEAEVLLRFALALDRNMLLRLMNEPVADGELRAYERALMRRFAGEPVAYITGSREFHGLDLMVTPAVLVPRPETEMLVDAALTFTRRCAQSGNEMVIADIGTGSGAIAISIAVAEPSAVLYATDFSPEALQIAHRNSKRHRISSRIAFRRGDLLEPIDVGLDLIVANLPYVTSEDWERLPRHIRDHEPRLALEAGQDGLAVIRRLLRQAPAYLRAGGDVMLEFGVGQSEAIQALARDHFSSADITVREDLAGIPRLLTIAT
jgi:release factor glutamine methyltransferase